MRVGLIHTTMNSIEPSNAAFRTMKDVETINFLDESVMPELRRCGATPAIRRRILALAGHAEEAGAAGIMLNCSLMSPHVAALAPYVGVPLIGADIAMLEYVAANAQRAGVIATVPKAGETTKALLTEMAASHGENIAVDLHIADGAFEALNEGNAALHDEMIRQAAHAFDGKVDKIVFAQISMVRALTPDFRTETEIVTSPVISARTLMERIREGGKSNA